MKKLEVQLAFRGLGEPDKQALTDDSYPMNRVNSASVGKNCEYMSKSPYFELINNTYNISTFQCTEAAITWIWLRYEMLKKDGWI